MIYAFGLLLIAQLAPGPAADTAQLIEHARGATAIYRDRNAAIRAGYRRIGPDLPEMGEHWLQPALLVDGGFDVKRPAVLNYIDVAGVPTLVGVAYALLLNGAEAAPDLAPGLRWHDHASSLSDEVIAGVGMRSGRARVAMLHAWVWTPNPAGTFTESNWALPYVRLGLTPPDIIDPAASRAASLLAGGDAYYAALLARITPERAAAFQARIETARGSVRFLLDRGDHRELAELWTMLAQDLARIAGPTAARSTSALLGSSAHGGHQ